MTEYQTISLSIVNAVARISLDRPEVRNAMNPTMIGEITSAFSTLNKDDGVRAIILRGSHGVFCAGGDLNWMKDVLGQTEEEVKEDSGHLLNMYRSINESPKLVIAALEGAVFAGGLGLIATSDVVIAEAKTKFCISEVKIGLTPGIIAAFILPRVGPSWMRYLSKTAVLFDCETARTAGLIHEIAKDIDDLEKKISAHIELALGASPEAIARTGKLIKELGHSVTDEALNTGLIYNAKARLSDEAQEGISSFLKKQKPSWIPEKKQR
ncbi:MAG: Methylmalonyl-CoA decarboxylase [Alphaproteobacteria bacterium MarineAlpha11_Bin1]|nr:MAG: Methylmalonyl-CoA decarboxylase [Alphaproteobacteria bacterium MarineAlpha11_Bin1]